jgi:glycosyltransferase involved in cell wall biosynthesis
MRIVINTRFANYAYEEGYGRFTREISGRLPAIADSDEFLFLYDRDIGSETEAMERVSHHVTGPPARHPLLWKFWYDYRVPAFLRRQRADVFLSPDGLCSLRTKVPQVMVIHDLAFLHYPAFLPRWQQSYLARHTPACIRKAARVITVSEFSRTDILRHYPFAEGKLEVVHNAADPAFLPLDWSVRQQSMDRYAEGCAYFLVVGSIHPRKNLINLLKGFSIFKKRQRSNMKLVITGRMAWQHGDFEEMLSRYVYRADVKLTGYLPGNELPALVGGAYALVYPSLWEGFGIPVLEAMQAGVPVLCSGNSALPEVAGEAGLFFDPLQPEDIAAQLSRVYKDEPGRAVMIRRGLERASGYRWEASARRVSEILREVADRR